MEPTVEEIEQIKNGKLDLKMSQSFEPYVASKKGKRLKIKRFWKIFLNDKEIFKGKFSKILFFYTSFKRNHDIIQAKVHTRTL